MIDTPETIGALGQPYGALLQWGDIPFRLEPVAARGNAADEIEICYRGKWLAVMRGAVEGVDYPCPYAEIAGVRVPVSVEWR